MTTTTLKLSDGLAGALEAVAEMYGVEPAAAAEALLRHGLAKRRGLIVRALDALDALDLEQDDEEDDRPAEPEPATEPAPPAEDPEDVDGPTGPHRRMKRCMVGEDCAKRQAARGMCSTHYSRWRSGTLPYAPDGTRSPALDPEPDPPADPADDPDVADVVECRIVGCPRPPMPGRDWCMRHNR